MSHLISSGSSATAAADRIGSTAAAAAANGKSRDN